MVEIRSVSRKLACPLCRGKFHVLVLYCTFEICEACHFMLIHEGRTPEENESHRLRNLERRVLMLESDTEAM